MKKATKEIFIPFAVVRHNSSPKSLEAEYGVWQPNSRRHRRWLERKKRKHVEV